MQECIFIDASIIRIKVFIIPLKSTVSGLFTISPRIINPNGNQIFFSETDQIGYIKSKSHHPIFMDADGFSIEIKFTRHANPFKFQPDFFPC